MFCRITLQCPSPCKDKILNVSRHSEVALLSVCLCYQNDIAKSYTLYLSYIFYLFFVFTSVLYVHAMGLSHSSSSVLPTESRVIFRTHAVTFWHAAESPEKLSVFRKMMRRRSGKDDVQAARERERILRRMGESSLPTTS